MPSDTANNTPTITWSNREIPIASPLRYTPYSGNDNLGRGSPDKKSGITNSRREPSWRGPARSDIECLLGWLDPRLTQRDFPIAIQFITHGLRTTVIFERCQ